MDYLYYSYCRKSTGREFFVPAQTLIVVKLFTNITSTTICVDHHHVKKTDNVSAHEYSHIVIFLDSLPSDVN